MKIKDFIKKHQPQNRRKVSAIDSFKDEVMELYYRGYGVDDIQKFLISNNVTVSIRTIYRFLDKQRKVAIKTQQPQTATSIIETPPVTAAMPSKKAVEPINTEIVAAVREPTQKKRVRTGAKIVEPTQILMDDTSQYRVEPVNEYMGDIPEPVYFDVEKFKAAGAVNVSKHHHEQRYEALVKAWEEDKLYAHMQNYTSFDIKNTIFDRHVEEGAQCDLYPPAQEFLEPISTGGLWHPDRMNTKGGFYLRNAYSKIFKYIPDDIRYMYEDFLKLGEKEVDDFIQYTDGRPEFRTLAARVCGRNMLWRNIVSPLGETPEDLLRSHDKLSPFLDDIFAVAPPKRRKI